MHLTYDSLNPVPISTPTSRNAKETRTFQGIPGIAKLPSGRLFATWYTGGIFECQKNYVILALSDDDGTTWKEAPFVIDPPHPDVRAFDATLWLSPDKRLFWFWAQGCGGDEHIVGIDNIFDGLVGVWYSILENPADAPQNFHFTQPRRISNGVMLNKPTVLSDGTWAMPCSLWSVASPNRAFHESLFPTYGAMMITSVDNGKTFTMRSVLNVAQPPLEASFDEHQFLEMRDGTIACYVRCGNGVGRFISNDDGKSWSKPELTDLPGKDCRFHIRRLSSGRILLVANNSKTIREKLTAFLSEDEGQTWPYQLLLDERIGSSYPDAIEDDQHAIYITHDYNRTQGGYLYLSKITEEDIIKGQISPSSFIRREIDHSKPVPPKIDKDK